MLSWEKPLVKPMAPRSTLHHISFPSTSYFCRRLFCNLYFPIYITKIPKIFILLSLSDLTFASGREGIDNPFITLVARFLIVCAGTRWLVCYLLLDWYLGFQNVREILMLLWCITLSSSRENQRKCSRGSTHIRVRGRKLCSFWGSMLKTPLVSMKPFWGWSSMPRVRLGPREPYGERHT